MPSILVVEQGRALQQNHRAVAPAQHRSERRQLGQRRHVADGDGPRRGTPPIEGQGHTLTRRQAIEGSGDDSSDPLSLRLLEEPGPVQAAAAEQPDEIVLGGGSDEPADCADEHAGDRKGTLNHVKAFINQVRAQSGQSMAPDDAAVLIGLASAM